MIHPPPLTRQSSQRQQSAVNRRPSSVVTSMDYIRNVDRNKVNHYPVGGQVNGYDSSPKPTHSSNVKKSDKWPSAKKGSHLSTSNSTAATASSTQSDAIWTTLQQAKDRQEAIRSRVRSYSSDENLVDSDDDADDEDAAPNWSNQHGRPEEQSSVKASAAKKQLKASKQPKPEEQDDDRKPLTPEDAIRIVLERNTYREDSSNSSDDDDIVPFCHPKLLPQIRDCEMVKPEPPALPAPSPRKSTGAASRTGGGSKKIVLTKRVQSNSTSQQPQHLKPQLKGKLEVANQTSAAPMAANSTFKNAGKADKAHCYNESKPLNSEDATRLVMERMKASNSNDLSTNNSRQSPPELPSQCFIKEQTKPVNSSCQQGQRQHHKLSLQQVHVSEEEHFVQELTIPPSSHGSICGRYHSQSEEQRVAMQQRYQHIPVSTVARSDGMGHKLQERNSSLRKGQHVECTVWGGGKANKENKALTSNTDSHVSIDQAFEDSSDNTIMVMVPYSHADHEHERVEDSYVFVEDPEQELRHEGCDDVAGPTCAAPLSTTHRVGFEKYITAQTVYPSMGDDSSVQSEPLVMTSNHALDSDDDNDCGDEFDDDLPRKPKTPISSTATKMSFSQNGMVALKHDSFASAVTSVAFDEDHLRMSQRSPSQDHRGHSTITTMQESIQNFEDDSIFFDAVQDSSERGVEDPSTIKSSNANNNFSSKGWGPFPLPFASGSNTDGKNNIDGPPQACADNTFARTLRKSSMSFGIEAISTSISLFSSAATSIGRGVSAVASSFDANNEQTGGSIFTSKTPKNPPKNTRIASRELEIIKKCQEQMKVREVEEAEKRANAAKLDKENMRLQREEELARAQVTAEVQAYRKMMQDMGQEEKLAPEDMKKAAEEYDDRLAMADTLQEQEAKAKLAQKNLAKVDMGVTLGGDETDESAASEYEAAGCCCVS